MLGAAVFVAASLGTLGVGSVSAASAQWNITRVGAPESAKGVTVAVVDTGVDRDHPAFGGRVLPQWDCTGPDNTCVQKDSGDQNGHGTHVAGTAAAGTLACGDAGPSAVGVAPDATVLPIRVLGADGSGSTTGVARGIDKAVELGADVINLSLGGDLQGIRGASSTLVDAINRAWKAGAIPVVAAGNGALFGLSFGSGYGDLDGVVVTATDNQDRAPGYADGVGGAEWGIAAPGGSGTTSESSVLSTLPGQRCGTKNGTSMAAPHVSGGLAVLRAKGLSKQQAVDRLLATAEDLGSRGRDGTYGAGLMNLAAATAGLGGAPAPAPTPAPAPSDPAPAPPVAADTGARSPAPAPPATGGTPPGTAADDPSTTTSTVAKTTTTDASDTTEARDGTTTLPTIGGDDETAAGDLEVNAADDGSVNVPAAATAALAAAAVWVVLGRNAARLRR